MQIKTYIVVDIKDFVQIYNIETENWYKFEYVTHSKNFIYNKFLLIPGYICLEEIYSPH